MKKIILIICTALLSSSAFTQELMTVEQYREKVLAYSQALKQVQENVTATQADVREAKSNMLPNISAAAEFTYLLNEISLDLAGFDLEYAKLSYGVSATVAQNVYSGGIVRKQIEALEIQNKIAEKTVDQTIDNISYAADLNYWSLAAMSSFKEATENYVDIIMQTHKIITDRYNDGLISKNDLLMIETRLQDAKYQLSSINKQYKEAAIRVNLFMGVAPDTEVLLADSLLNEPVILPAYKDLDYALSNRAEFNITELKIASATQALKLVKAQYLPQLAVGAVGQYATPLLNFTGDAMQTYAAFGKLNIPIFAGNSKKHRSASVQAKIRQSEYEKQKVTDDINQELSVAWSNITNTFNQIEVADQNLKISEESLELNTFSYNAGVLTLLDVLTSQLSWLTAYNNMISTKFNFIQATSAYSKATGY
ncbi:MAG: TolC family protein [Rikenellaceae bacterium]